MTTATKQAEATGQAAPREADAATVSGWLAGGQAVLVDVREPDERAREWIPGSVAMPLSGFDATKLRGLSAARIVFHCRGGQRSMQACRAAVAAAPAGVEVLSLRGGIEAWKSAGLAVQTGVGPRMSVMRQTQLVIGLVVAAGTALGFFVHPALLILPAFMGAGLIFAGASGTCGLAMLLARMPWNTLETKGDCCGGGQCGS
jgi:rhodanese-related sulfurtransferase